MCVCVREWREGLSLLLVEQDLWLTNRLRSNILSVNPHRGTSLVSYIYIVPEESAHICNRYKTFLSSFTVIFGPVMDFVREIEGAMCLQGWVSPFLYIVWYYLYWLLIDFSPSLPPVFLFFLSFFSSLSPSLSSVLTMNVLCVGSTAAYITSFMILSNITS